MYGAAWSQMNLGTIGQNTDATADADRWFSRLITAYPEHPLATDAKVGRASARRLLGDVENASKDLIDVASDPEANRTQAGDDASEPVQRLETAWFELGLLHAKGKSWNDAEKVFAQLIAEYPQSPNLDRYRYELAWAYQSQTPAKSAAALEQFATIVDQTPDSEFVAEAHFHLADAAKAREDFETAARLYRVVVESNLPAAVRERSRYNLAWLDFQAERFDAAAKQFEDQLAEFPKGRLATDAKFMFAESQFRQQNHRDALQAYLVAKPAIEMASQVDQKMRTLTALHGAASANEAGEFEQAIRLARPITDDEFDPAYRADAWLQLGVAQAGSGDQISAIESWHNATPSLSVTGAQARCLIGRALTDAGRTREALNEFRKVFLGFGGSQAEDEVRPWQAFALYESARLNQSLCRDARGDQLQRLVTAATEQYQQLVDHYGDSDLAEEATKQLEKLSKF
jgi:TolA-binding protein